MGTDTENFSLAYHRRLIYDANDNLARVEIESAGQVILAANADNAPFGALVVNPNADLHVFADEIVIFGCISLHGRNVKLFARRIYATPKRPGDTLDSGTIDVRGKWGEEPPEPLKAGASSKAHPHKKKLAVGETGSQGYCNRIWPTPEGSSVDFAGGDGWSGSNHPDEMNGEEGEEGAPAGNGGNVLICCGELCSNQAKDYRYPFVYARGGHAYQGQEGQAGAQGGMGGNGADTEEKPWGWVAATAGGRGGNGGAGGQGGKGGRGGDAGNVEILATNGANYRPGFPPDGYVLCQGGVEGKGGAGGKGGQGGNGGAGGKPSEYCKRHLVDAYGKRPYFYGGPLDDDATYRAVWQATVYGGAVGGDGDPGADGKPGDDGDCGRDGTVTINTAAGYADLAPHASLTQLQMILESLFLEAAVVDAEDAETAASLSERLGWLQGLLLEISSGLPANDPSKLVASRLNTLTFQIASNLALGRNAFGKLPSFVPAGSLDTWQAQLAKAKDNLKNVEEPAKDYLTKVWAGEDARASLVLAHDQVEGIKIYLENELKAAKNQREELEIRLNKAESHRKNSRQSLEPLMYEVAAQVRKYFHVEPALFLNALSQMAFLETGSAPKATSLLTGQVGSVIYDAATTIQNNGGEKFDKAFVLGQLKSFDAGQMGAELSANSQGFFNDSSSYRYLVDANKFRDFIRSFLGNPEVKAIEELESALTKQIQAVEQRNRLVDEYNDLVRRVLDLRATSLTIEEKIRKIGDKGSQLADPSEPALVAYVTGLWERAKWEALRQLYFAHRARVFWSLDADPSLATLLGISKATGGDGALIPDRTAVIITSTIIGSAQGKLQSAINTAFEAARKTPNLIPSPEGEAAFPEDGTLWLSTGVLVVLTREQHPQIFSDLCDFEEASFELLPASSKSTAPKSPEDPVVSIEPKVKTEVADPLCNPFCDLANVRLRRVRVFLDEPNATGLHRLVLIHGGDERFITSADKPFPEQGYLSHEPVTIPFKYIADRFRFRPTLGFTASVLHGSGTEDGDLQFPQNNDVLPANCKYAPIGPFGKWTLRIKSHINPGLDLNMVNRIFIDFHVFHDTF